MCRRRGVESTDLFLPLFFRHKSAPEESFPGSFIEIIPLSVPLSSIIRWIAVSREGKGISFRRKRSVYARGKAEAIDFWLELSS